MGVIDCTHVQIVAPRTTDPERPESVFVNRKGTHSINVQVVKLNFLIFITSANCITFQICDYRGRIININGQFPGGTHDAFVWRNSAAGQALKDFAAQHNEEAFFILGKF